MGHLTPLNNSSSRRCRSDNQEGFAIENDINTYKRGYLRGLNDSGVRIKESIDFVNCAVYQKEFREVIVKR